MSYKKTIITIGLSIVIGVLHSEFPVTSILFFNILGKKDFVVALLFVSSISMIYPVIFGKSIKEKLILSLIAATLAICAGELFMILRYYFAFRSF